MASYAIEFRHSAEHDIRRLAPALLPRILKALEALSDDPIPRQALKLEGSEQIYRLRIGRYRAIYSVNQEKRIIIVYYVRHRRDAYRGLK
jgi:mRNA interferase RelE/StbE